MNKETLVEMNQQLEDLRNATERLMALSKEHAIPAVYKNSKKILACLKMMELHIRDPLEFLEDFAEE